MTERTFEQQAVVVVALAALVLGLALGAFFGYLAIPSSMARAVAKEHCLVRSLVPSAKRCGWQDTGECH